MQDHASITSLSGLLPWVELLIDRRGYVDGLMHAYIPKQSGASSDQTLIMCGKQCRMTPHAALLAESRESTCVLEQ